MIEIICRDGSITDEELILQAQLLEQTSGRQVVPLTSFEACACTFWGVDDVHVALEEQGYDELSMSGEEQCANFLKLHEKELHSAMVDAGWRYLGTRIDQWAQTLTDQPQPE